MTNPVGEGFPKAARICRRREFLSLGRTARRSSTPHLILLAQTGAAPCRLGITVSKKVGGAVVRNRLKRRLREAFRRHPERLRMGGNLIVIAKVGAGSLSGHDVEREFSTGVERHPLAAKASRG